jgi:hypothetical protein
MEGSGAQTQNMNTEQLSHTLLCEKFAYFSNIRRKLFLTYDLYPIPYTFPF